MRALSCHSMFLTESIAETRPNRSPWALFGWLSMLFAVGNLCLRKHLRAIRGTHRPSSLVALRHQPRGFVAANSPWEDAFLTRNVGESRVLGFRLVTVPLLSPCATAGNDEHHRKAQEHYLGRNIIDAVDQ